MKIPEQLKIGANTVKVIKRSNEQIGEGDGGTADWNSNTLTIANDLPEDRQAVIFMHEILHFVNIYLSEKEATYLSESLMQVIRDNDLRFNETNT